MLFTNEDNPGEAVSAVKALAIASAEGQRIYKITQDNVNAVLPVLNISSEVKDEIRASVAVGKEATISQNDITVGGWTGVGYIITDPDTGGGAYRISGGSNGAAFLAGIAQGAASSAMITLVFASLSAGIMSTIAMLILVVAFLLPILLIAVAYADTVYTSVGEQDCLSAGNTIGILSSGFISALRNAGISAGTKEIVAGVSSSLLISWYKKVIACL